jgi:hypothetical protein
MIYKSKIIMKIYSSLIQLTSKYCFSANAKEVEIVVGGVLLGNSGQVSVKSSKELLPAITVN